MNLNKSLLSGLLWVLLLNVLIKPLWIIGIEVGVQNAVGDVEYGRYFAIFSIAYIFNILLDLGLTNYNTRHIARHPEGIKAQLSSIFTLKCLLLVLYLAVTLTVGLLRGFDHRGFHLLLLVCVNQFLCSMISYLRSNYEGLLLFKWDGVLSVLDRVVMIVLCGVLLILSRSNVIGAFRLEWFVFSQTVAYLITLVVALLVLVRKVGFFKPRLAGGASLRILRRSAPFALLVFLMACYNRIDPVLLVWLLPAESGAQQSGIYAAAYRLLDALSMIGYLVSVPLLPVFSKMLDSVQRTSLGDTIRWVFSLLLAYALGAAITFSTMSEQLMTLLYDASAGATAQVFRLLIFDLVPISITYVFGTLLTAQGRLRTLNLLATISLLINIMLNIVLIPRHGALGAACSSLCAQSFMAIAQMVVAVRSLHIPTKQLNLVNVLLYAVLVFALNLLLHHLCPASPWWLTLSVMVVACLLLALCFRLIDIAHLKAVYLEDAG